MSESTSDWLICMLVRVGEFHPRDPFCLGAVEFTRTAEWDPRRESELAASARAFGVNLDRAFMRARVVLADTDERDAIAHGPLHIQEAADLLPQAVHLMARPVVVGPGVVANLRGTGVHRLLPPVRSPRDFPSFQIDEFATGPKIAIDRVLAADPALTGELGKRLRRSGYWYRLAGETHGLAPRLLNLWIASEALSKTDTDENPTAKFLAGLGMPRGHYMLQMDASAQQAFRSERHRIQPWSKRLAKLFDRARFIRNAIAHAGEREIEIRGQLTDDEVWLLVRVLEMLVPRLQSLVVRAIFQFHMSTLGEFWRSYGTIYAASRESAPITADTVGTIIYSLEHR